MGGMERYYLVCRRDCLRAAHIRVSAIMAGIALMSVFLFMPETSAATVRDDRT